MSRASLKKRRRVISVEEMTHDARIHISVLAEATNKPLHFAISGPNNRRCGFRNLSSIDVRKDNGYLMLATVHEILERLKYIRGGKVGERSRRHQPKCRCNVTIRHS
jgi:hypothetical protein